MEAKVGLSVYNPKGRLPFVSDDTVPVIVDIAPPNGSERAQVDICCVIDVSGSMNDEAALVGKKEKTWLSVLDVVKHAVRTIITALGDSDRLAIVAYSTEAKESFALTSMTKEGKKKAEDALDKLTPEGNTNLWGGLLTGLKVLEKKRRSGAVTSVMLLTDGMPNIVPDEGHLRMLKGFLKAHQQLDVVINTFGFGYALDSKLLNDLAVLGNGSYAFIPDSSFVGTIFINALSNLLATFASKYHIELKPQGGATLASIPVLPSINDSEEATVSSPQDVELDLVFLVDCTGSMGSYIAEAQRNIKSIVDKIVTSERADVRFGLVSYRDHPPQEKTYVTEVQQFTNDLAVMKKAVDKMAAVGGGDTPEAVATGMSDALNKLKYRKESTKVVVLIADAPPHGLGSPGDGFPGGEPNNIDPIKVAREMASKGIAVYSVGCEPAINSEHRTVSFFRGISQITGGRYVPLADAALLSNAIIGSCREELSLYRVALPVLLAVEKNNGDVEKAVKAVASLSINTLQFDDPNEEAYRRQVAALLESKSLSEAKGKLDSIPVPKATGAKPQVSVIEGSTISKVHVQVILKKYLNQKEKLVKLEEKRSNKKPLKKAKSIANGTTLKVGLGSLYFGQNKSVIVKLNVPKDHQGPLVTASLTYWLPNGASSTVVLGLDREEEATVEAHLHLARAFFIEQVLGAVKLMEKDHKLARKAIKEAVERFDEYSKSAGKKLDERLKGINEDMEGQVTEAFSKTEWYNKWGVHYLPSLLLAHQLQHCNNFKDPGVQHYGGKIFNDERSKADKLFLEIPAPKPSLLPPPEATKTATAPTTVHMGDYYDKYGGCFGGDSVMRMADGSTKVMRELRKGDLLATPSGRPTAVVCLVKTMIPGRMDLVRLSDGLYMTPWHPVALASSPSHWVFPCEVGERVSFSHTEVFNLVVEHEHVVIANSTHCVTLGHSFKGDKREHTYFGSQQVIDDLKALPGWTSGQVILSSEVMTLRDKDTMLVTGLAPTRSSPFLTQKQDKVLVC